MDYVRFRSAHPNKAGFHVGIFGLVNVLGRHGMLTPDEERFRRENNDWYDAAFPEPPIYGDQLHPHAAAWFKPTASQFLGRVPGYLAILDAHRIAWEEVRTTDPGMIIYSDEFQVVAIPNEFLTSEESDQSGSSRAARRPVSLSPGPVAGGQRVRT